MKKLKFFSLLLAASILTLASWAQSADEIIAKHIEAIGGADNWKKVNSIRQEATLSVQGMDIPVIVTLVHNKGSKQEFTVMGMTGYTIITNEGGWSFNPMMGQSKPEPMTSDDLKYGKDQLDAQGEFLNYKEKGHSVESLGKEDIDGTECFKIKLTRKSGTESVFFIDPKTYYPIRISSKVVANGQEVESIVNLSNYQKLPEGIVVPFTMENSQMPAPITMTKIVINAPIDESIFKVGQ
jgi:outer membrane lipoprotein-sorting protein